MINLFRITSYMMKLKDINSVLQAILLKHDQRLILFRSFKGYRRYRARYNELKPETIAMIRSYVEKNKLLPRRSRRKLLSLEVIENGQK